MPCENPDSRVADPQSGGTARPAPRAARRRIHLSPLEPADAISRLVSIHVPHCGARLTLVCERRMAETSPRSSFGMDHVPRLSRSREALVPRPVEGPVGQAFRPDGSAGENVLSA